MDNSTQVQGSSSKSVRKAAALAATAALAVGSEATQAPEGTEAAAPEAPKRTIEEQYLENQSAIDTARAALTAAEAKQTDLANRCKAAKVTQMTIGGRKCQVRKESNTKEEKSENHYFHFLAPREESAPKDAASVCV